jgi:Zn ribbon nucleic-acid-binding protein
MDEKLKEKMFCVIMNPEPGMLEDTEPQPRLCKEHCCLLGNKLLPAADCRHKVKMAIWLEDADARVEKVKSSFYEKVRKLNVIENKLKEAQAILNELPIRSDYERVRQLTEILITLQKTAKEANL